MWRFQVNVVMLTNLIQSLYLPSQRIELGKNFNLPVLHTSVLEIHACSNPSPFLAYLFRVKEERRVRGVSARSNICIFFHNTKAISFVFEDECKTA